jgi:uncharacterized protein YegP (UPF0339 family)
MSSVKRRKRQNRLSGFRLEPFGGGSDQEPQTAGVGYGEPPLVSYGGVVGAVPPAESSSVEFFTDAAGKHRWRQVSSNGEIVASSSQGYASVAGARKNAAKVLVAV